MPSNSSGSSTDFPPVAALPESQAAPRGPRDRRYLRALWLSLPVVLAVALGGALLLTLNFYALSALKQVRAGDLPRSQAMYERTAAATRWGPAPWVAQYNLGTVLLAQGDTAGGIASLERAFEKVPKAIPDGDGRIESFSYECQVRINLASGWENVGDEHRERGDLGKAVETYDSAAQWSRPCELVGETGSDGEDQPVPPPGGGQMPGEGEEDPGASTTERLEQKRDSAQRELTGEDPQNPAETSPSQPEEVGAPPPDPFAGETEAEREKREQLEQKNREQTESEREREESQNRRSQTRGW